MPQQHPKEKFMRIHCMKAIDRLVPGFHIPLESANVEIDLIRQKLEGMLSYAG